MYTTYFLTISSIKMFLRNKQALFFTLFMPFIIMLIFGYIGFDKPPKIDIGIVTHNPNTATQNFINQIKQFPTFTVHEGGLEVEQKELIEGNRSSVLDIPGDFFSSEQSESPKTIRVYSNAGQEGQAKTVISILSQIMDKITLEAVHAPTLFTVHEEVINAHNLRYIEFLLPGLIALSIMQMSVFSVAFVFAQFKEKGILKRLLATPMRPWQFVTSNVITRLLVAIIQTTIFIVLGILLFKVHVIGSYALLFLVALLGSIMFLGLGFTISGLAKTVDSVPALANIFVFPMLFLGGTFIAISNMPNWLQAIAKFLPLTYFSTALRDVMTKGSGFNDIIWDIFGMIIWGAILIGLATITFGFQEKESA